MPMRQPRTLAMEHPWPTTLGAATAGKEQRQRQSQSKNRLDDVLRDPDASWSQIREAMRASRGCTNAAVMGAIASGRGGAMAVLPPLDDGGGEGSNGKVRSVGGTRRSPSPDIAVGEVADENDGPSPFVGEIREVPLNDAADPSDLTNSRPARRPARRGSLRRSARASLRRSRRNTLRDGNHLSSPSLHSSERSAKSSGAGSIDMMDFGVDHGGGAGGMSALDESTSLDGDGAGVSLSWHSYGDGLSLSRHSHPSGLSLSRHSCGDDTTSYASDSLFLGWNHDDDESSAGVGSSYSDMVDSAGFLDWERKGSWRGEEGCDPASPAPERVESVTVALRGSLDAPAATDRARETTVEAWNIEDYENPEDNVVKKRSGRFFGPKRRIAKMDHQEAGVASNGANNVAGKGDTIRMDAIKEALIKVAHGSEKNELLRSAPGLRRASLDEGCPRSSLSRRRVKEMKGPRRRQTIVEMPTALLAFLGGEPKNGNSKDGELRRIPSLGSEGNPSRQSRPGRGTLSGLSLFLSHEAKPPNETASRRESSKASRRDPGLPELAPANSDEGGMWDSRRPRSDSRDAIWINRKDGGVDIDKECWRLYNNPESSGPADGKDPRKREGGFQRRTTLFRSEMPAGLSRPGAGGRTASG